MDWRMRLDLQRSVIIGSRLPDARPPNLHLIRSSIPRKKPKKHLTICSPAFRQKDFSCFLRCDEMVLEQGCAVVLTVCENLLSGIAATGQYECS